MAKINGEKGKFICKHCNEVMDVSMIYLHVRSIFNIPLYKCHQCHFSTDHAFHQDHHSAVTGHLLSDEKDLNPVWENIVNYVATTLMNSIVNNSKSKKATMNISKPHETRRIDNLENAISGNTANVQRKSGSKRRKRFFSNTIFLINDMSFKYENKNNSSEGKLETLDNHIFLDVRFVETYPGAGLPKNKHFTPRPPFSRNKMVLCQKCGKEVRENYISRRKHVFLNHQDDIMHKLKDIEILKRTDILFKGFMVIRDCFPEYAVCSDFQCVDCGYYYSSMSGVRYHVGLTHQKSIIINCPFEDCEFKTGGDYHAKDHIRTHLKEVVDKKDKLSINNLASYVSPQSYTKFNSSCEVGNKIIKSIVKHYIPINISYYDNFQDDFKSDLSEFKKSYLQPYILDGLIKDNHNQGMNESEVISSYNDTNEELDYESDVPEENMLERSSVSFKKRKRDFSNSVGSDAVFSKEIASKSRKTIYSEEPTSSGLPIIKDNFLKDSFNQAKKTKNNDVSVENPSVPRLGNKENAGQAVENSKLVKFKKEVPLFETVARNLLQNKGNNKIKEEIVPRPNISLNVEKVKTGMTALTAESRVEKPYKDFVYETYSTRGEEMRAKLNKRDFSRERSDVKYPSHYNDSGRHSLASHNDDGRKNLSMSCSYGNSSKYSKSTYNQKYFSYR
uniref:C2H2-type domain-containing protein n=1 Tax=Strongyloides papillosus TaxID=174720 RepID=A0A0N5BWI9_STREA